MGPEEHLPASSPHRVVQCTCMTDLGRKAQPQRPQAWSQGRQRRAPSEQSPPGHHRWANLSACRPAPSPTPAASHACAGFLIIEKVQLGHKAATSDSKSDLDALCSARWVSVWPFTGCGRRRSAAVWPGGAGSPATLEPPYGSPGMAPSGRCAARGHAAPGPDALRRGRDPERRQRAGGARKKKCGSHFLVSSFWPEWL